MLTLSLSAATLLLSATGGIATQAHSARLGHSGLAQRMGANSSPLEKRDQFTGLMTWYPNDTGPDACTGKNHIDSDWYVAMATSQYGDGSACCGKQLRISYNGKSAVATCVDECPTCSDYGDLDLTKGLFEYFNSGELGVGQFDGSWSFVDGSSSGNDDPPPPPKTTTTSTHTSTHTSTTTTSSTTTTTTTTHSSSSSSSTTSSSTTSHSSSPSSYSASATHSSASATPTPSAPTGPQNIAHFSEAAVGLLGLVVQAAEAQ